MPLTVVVVDDEPMIRDLLRLRLRLDGRFAVVAEANDPDHGLTLVQDHRPDVVLLDVHLAEDSGLRVLEAMAARSPDTKLVVFSGAAQPEMVERAYRLGAHLVVEKLMNPDALADAMAALCTAGGAPSDGADNPRESLGKKPGIR
ncbi:MAG: hypothetical protein QOI20_107 [Acidimicrobiaceae bacterium]|jgi:DNA-binding NarL/FixJ family response regulator|nr:hypothetical protein [Acidimicrobiaceae bacterium]